MKTRAFLFATLAVATTTLSASAQQPWLEDRRLGEGIGIRTGNLELHPGIAAQLGYDSNYFQRADDEDPISMYRIRITPSLSLATLGQKRRSETGAGAPPTVNFRAGVHASYNELIATDSAHADEAADQRNVSAGANFTLDVLPQRPWGFDMYGDFVRTAEPSNSALNDLAFDRDALRLGAGINWRPGGGLFDWRLGYELNLHHFERNAYQQFNNTQHYLKTRGRWRFMPRTALIYDGEVGFLRFSQPTFSNDAQTVRTRIGMNGLITYHFAMLALAGWAASFYENTTTPSRNYDGPVGQLELKWFPLPQPNLDPSEATVGLASIAAGYVRDYTHSYLSSYFRRDRGYLNASYFVGGSVLLSAEGGLSHLSHSSSFFPPPDGLRSPPFKDNRVDVSLFGEYRPSDTIGINLNLRYNAALDDNRIQTVPGSPETDNLQFTRYEAWLGVRWFM